MAAPTPGCFIASAKSWLASFLMALRLVCDGFMSWPFMSSLVAAADNNDSIGINQNSSTRNQHINICQFNLKQAGIYEVEELCVFGQGD